MLLQFAIGLMQGVEGAFNVTLSLPNALSKEITRLMKQRLPGSNLGRRRQLAGAIAVLAVKHGIAQSGLRGHAQNPEQAQAISALMLLAQLAEIKRDDLTVDFSVSGNAVEARFAFRKSAGSPPHAPVKRLH